MSNKKPGLVIFYDHFYPAYKAGGPIQSLTNLVLYLQDTYKISFITSAYDLNDHNILDGVNTDKWTTVNLPGAGTAVNVWYAKKGNMGMSAIREAVRQADPDFIYLNGMFSYAFMLVPLMLFRKHKIVICPRGMLQKGALAGKALKKKVYLYLLKMSGLCKMVTWHATNTEELNDIMAVFGPGAKVMVAGNIPRKPVKIITPGQKRPGELHLVYLSLISAKKNLLQLVNIIGAMEENITLDIYGPVKDETYWLKCLNVINRNDGKIKYKGDVLPGAVQGIFEKYDASVLLTKGENFGHALYESFSAGRPVITSYFTPWEHLVEKNAGWNIDITHPNELNSVLKRLCNMEESAYAVYYTGAHQLAKEYYRAVFETGEYKRLFS